MNKTQKFLSSKIEVGKAYILHLAVKRLGFLYSHSQLPELVVVHCMEP